MSNCKYCGAEVVWEKIDGRNVPVNAADGSRHDCRQGSQYGGPAPAPTQQRMNYQDQQWQNRPNDKRSSDRYPTGAEKREGADIDRQTIIVWQNMMSHAVEIRKMCGDFPANASPEEMASLTKEVVIIAWNLMEEARKVWTHGVPESVTESAKVSG
jgi:hypothetical protein